MCVARLFAVCTSHDEATCLDVLDGQLCPFWLFHIYLGRDFLRLFSLDDKVESFMHTWSLGVEEQVLFLI